MKRRMSTGTSTTCCRGCVRRKNHPRMPAAAFEARNDPGDAERAAADREEAEQYES